MDALQTVFRQLPPVLVPVLALVPLLVWVLGRLRERELVQTRAELAALRAGVGRHQLVLERLFVHPIKVRAFSPGLVAALLQAC